MESPPAIQPSRFFNRVAEPDSLQRAYSTPSPNGQLFLVSGRRRLGKTFLLQRFFAGAPGESSKPHCYHLADQSNAPEQRESIARQLLETFPESGTESERLVVTPTRSGAIGPERPCLHLADSLPNLCAPPPTPPTG